LTNLWINSDPNKCKITVNIGQLVWSVASIIYYIIDFIFRCLNRRLSISCEWNEKEVTTVFHSNLHLWTTYSLHLF